MGERNHLDGVVREDISEVGRERALPPTAGRGWTFFGQRSGKCKEPETEQGWHVLETEREGKAIRTKSRRGERPGVGGGQGSIGL